MSASRARTDGLIEELLAAPNLAARWTSLTDGLAEFGIDQINYGIIELAFGDQVEAPVRFLSTMDPGWLGFYADERIDRSDPHVILVRKGNLMPYRWGESALPTLSDPAARKAVQLTVEAGLRGQISVALSDANATMKPIGGMTIGSSLREREFQRVTTGMEAQLVTIAHLFNGLSIGEIRRQKSGAKALSPRERECLQHTATGCRIDAVADKLGLARVTVEMHLASARIKMKAATLPQAVANAILFQEIRLS